MIRNEIVFDKFKQLLVSAESVGVDVVKKIAAAGLERWKEDEVILAKLVAFFWERVVRSENHNDQEFSQIRNVYMRLTDKALEEYAGIYLPWEKYKVFTAILDDEMARIELEAGKDGTEKELGSICDRLAQIGEELAKIKEEQRQRMLDQYVELWDDRV
jgi:hypothetical protein